MITKPRVVSLTFLAVGVFLLVQVVMPIVSFQLWELGQNVNSEVLISPKQTTQILGVSVENKDNFPLIVSNLTRVSKANYDQFLLSVPKLKIDGAIVWVDSNDLSKGLAHLPGSALPGERGNVFISGHSALSPIFNFKTAAFAKLQDLKKGDQIVVKANNTQYIYKVVELRVVHPSDVSVIIPPDTMNRFISLMTCVPPGLNFKRLVILGKMI